VRLISREFEEMKFNVMEPDLKIQYIPDTEGLKACEDLGRRVAVAMKSR